MFAITRFRYIKVLFHVFYIVRYNEDFVIQRFVTSRFHCRIFKCSFCTTLCPGFQRTYGSWEGGSLNLLLRNRSTSSVVSFFREPYHIRLQFVISPLGTNIIFVVTISGSVDTLLYHQVFCSFSCQLQKKRLLESLMFSSF